MRVLKLIEFSELKFLGQPFDQIAVSDFLLILEDAVTQQFAQHVSYY